MNAREQPFGVPESRRHDVLELARDYRAYGLRNHFLEAWLVPSIWAGCIAGVSVGLVTLRGTVLGYAMLAAVPACLLWLRAKREQYRHAMSDVLRGRMWTTYRLHMVGGWGLGSWSNRDVERISDFSVRLYWSNGDELPERTYEPGELPFANITMEEYWTALREQYPKTFAERSRPTLTRLP